MCTKGMTYPSSLYLFLSEKLSANFCQMDQLNVFTTATSYAMHILFLFSSLPPNRYRYQQYNAHTDFFYLDASIYCYHDVMAQWIQNLDIFKKSKSLCDIRDRDPQILS